MNRLIGICAALALACGPALANALEFSKAIRRVSPSIVLVRSSVPHAEPAPHEDIITGTGVVMTKDGSILTNAHVVEDAKTVEVYLPPFQFVEASVVGLNREIDIALLKIPVPNEHALKPATWGNSQTLQVGDAVIKGGFPGAVSSQRPSFAHGIITNMRAFTGQFSTPLIATDAQISRGDSGGPLFNGKGEVVGIDVRSSPGVAGYAIPASIVRPMLARLAKGDVHIGWLGFLPGNLLDLREMHGDRMLKKRAQDFFAERERMMPVATEGFVVMAFEQQEQGGGGKTLQFGDVITRMNDRAPQDGYELVQWITETEPGSEITLAIIRDGKEARLRLAVGEFDWKIAKQEHVQAHQEKEGTQKPK